LTPIGRIYAAGRVALASRSWLVQGPASSRKVAFALRRQAVYGPAAFGILEAIPKKYPLPSREGQSLDLWGHGSH
jgi:hypothetical protein